ncbi:DUF2059 domain-containing protein [Azorhizobium sp. AG788]|uniref:DUF2059 domain-containing protein n=1 Tax=Azorhizobium sp. AG788 TaxID=2183897 RepID=UPI003139177E
MALSRSARRLSFGVMALVLSATGALAQSAGPAPTPSQMQVARQLVEANGEARAFDGVIPNIVDGAALGFLQTNPDLAKQLRESATAVKPEFEKRKGEIVDIIATAYASRFTEQELKDALAFFSSSVGKKMVSDRAQIVQQSVANIQAWGGKLNAEAMERIRAEMKKLGYDL